MIVFHSCTSPTTKTRAFSPWIQTIAKQKARANTSFLSRFCGGGKSCVSFPTASEVQSRPAVHLQGENPFVDQTFLQFVIHCRMVMYSWGPLCIDKKNWRLLDLPDLQGILKLNSSFLHQDIFRIRQQVSGIQGDTDSWIQTYCGWQSSSVSNGIPTALDWVYQEKETVKLENLEKDQGHRRHPRLVAQ